MNEIDNSILSEIIASGLNSLIKNIKIIIVTKCLNNEIIKEIFY